MWALKDEASYHQLKAFISQMSSFLELYTWLSDSFMLEFFTEDHWKKLPQSWQNALDNLDLSELANWLSPQENIVYKKVWPLSLMCFRAAAHSFTVSRNTQKSLHTLMRILEGAHQNDACQHFHGTETTILQSSAHASKSQPRISKSAFMWDSSTNHFKHSLLPHQFRRCVKPKKQHEILRLAEVICLVMEQCKSQLIFDVGAGQGHLSRLLSLGYGFRVISLDAEGLHTTEARKLDAKALQWMSKQRNQTSAFCENTARNFENDSIETTLRLPHHIVKQINADASGKEFLDVISNCNERLNAAHLASFVLVGLHTCGDLASTLHKIFSHCQHAAGIVSVGCCYMKLHTREENPDQPMGYPLSSFVQSLANSTLSYQAREVACHAIEMYRTLLKQNATKLKIHCYRAVLEVVITKHYPSKKRSGLRSVKKAETMTFKQYSELATEKLGIHLPEADLTSSMVENLLHHWKDVIVFYSLRLLVAPVIETMLLMDRLLFLYENGYHSCIFPVFDPTVSPRNHVIVGVKPEYIH